MLLAAGLLVTAAAVTDTQESLALLDGSGNRFDLVTTGSPEPGWAPAKTDWAQGNPSPYQIALTGDGSGYLMSPGSRLDLRIAVKNDSPRLAGEVSLEVEDPRDRGEERDPVTGNFVELFPQLIFTIRDGERVLAERVLAPDLITMPLAASLSPGDSRVLDVSIALPESLDNRWQRASTDVQFRFEGISR